jgi:dihydroneopterin aldolase
MNIKANSLEQKKYCLEIDELITYASIGVSEAEKIEKQQLKWFIKIHFVDMPLACVNDSIDSTVCYNEIANLVKKVCAAKSYNLIEHLCFEAYNLIKPVVHQAPLTITILKNLQSNLSYTSKFTICDLEKC